MRAQDFLVHDACHVCGQTPCNCTHISEAKTMIVPDNNVASAKKLYQYLVRNLIDIASMISFYEENYNKPYYEKKFDGFFKDSAGNPVKVIFDDGAKVEYESGILYIPAATYYRYRGFLTGQRFIPDVLNALGTPMEQSVAEDLRKWFKEKWVRFGPDGKIRGDCARGDDSEGKPKCLPQSKAHALGKKGRASAAARKRRQDPNPERKGAAINVATKKKSNEALIREVQNKMFHEVLADRLPAGIAKDEEIVRSAWEIAAQKMGPVRATRLFREVPGFDHDLIAAYRAKHPVNEARDQTLSDAQAIAAQIRDHMDEYYNLQRSGRKDAGTLSALNMSKRSVAALNQELQQLGYKYAPTVAGLAALKGTPFVEEGAEQCPECGGPMFSDLLLAEKKDACYNKVRSRYKVWPSAYASGALVQCRKKGAANWGNKSKNESVAEGLQPDSDLAVVGVKILNALKAKCQEIDRDHPELWETLTSDKWIQSGMPYQFVKDYITVDKHTLKTFFNAWEEVGGDPFHDWPLFWRDGQWDDFVAPWRQYAHDVLKSRGVNPTPPGTVHEGVAEGSKQQYLWHGSRQKIPMLEPRQSVDTGGAAGSNQNAIYATSDPKVAIAMGLTTSDSDTGMFPNDPQMVLFSGKIRKGENVYLHKVPMNGPDGKPQFVQGGNSREFHSVPGVKGIKPTEIKAVPVDKYLNLIRQATPQDLELRKKYMNQGVAEGSGQEPGEFEIYDLRTMKRVYHPFEANDIMDAFVKADDWLEAIGKSGRGLSVRPVKDQGVAEQQLDEKCWDTHRQEGMKRKGDRMVPNCVPKESTAPKSAIGAAIAQARR